MIRHVTERRQRGMDWTVNLRGVVLGKGKFQIEELMTAVVAALAQPNSEKPRSPSS